jgi:endonuclease/exonuclease/phosphatase (EEP) superfamily protein YafD
MKQPGFFSPRFRLVDFCTAGGVVLSAATACGFLGRFWWLFDLCAHFRVQYFVGLAALAILLGFGHRYFATAAFTLFSIINLWTIVPLYLGKEAPPPPTSSKYRGVLMNVNTGTGDPAKVGSFIEQSAPDVLALEEIDERWLSSLAGPLSHYPFSKIVARSDNFGIGLFSRYPFSRCEVLELGDANVPSIVAELKMPDGRLTMIATHPLPPGGLENSRLRNDQLSRIPELVKRAGSRVLLLGDINATPWCYPFQRLLSDSGLRDASQGRGILATWPTFLPIALIPIDHCLHSPGIYINREATGPSVGSDHFPLVVDFSFTSSPAEAPVAPR